MRGLRKHLTPFAPDQSGAVSVLFELGGIIVVCDAGGCTGNICGFDEPRWHTMRSAVFSAGLRDMDAILGRDDKLVAGLADAASKMDASFAAIVGTPVPAVIGTDFSALRRMSERRVGLPAITVDANGTELYDEGARKALLALFERFATREVPVVPGRVGILGANPLDLGTTDAEEIRSAVPGAVCYGMGAGIDDVRRASSAERNLVIAPSGLDAARLLKRRFGTPYELGDPRADRYATEIESVCDVAGAKVLVIAQQVTAASLRRALLSRGAAQVRCATWFTQPKEAADPGDLRLREEDDLTFAARDGGYDLIVGDAVLAPLIDDSVDATFFDLPQFSVSGRLARTAR